MTRWWPLAALASFALLFFLWRSDRAASARSRVSEDSMKVVVQALHDRHQAFTLRAAADSLAVDSLRRAAVRHRVTAARAETLSVAITDTLRVTLPDTLLPLLSRLSEAHRRQIDALGAVAAAESTRADTAEAGLRVARGLLVDTRTALDRSTQLLAARRPDPAWSVVGTVDVGGVNACVARRVARVPLLGTPLAVGACYRLARIR